MTGIRVYLTFYTTGREQTRDTVMPQVPAAGDSLHWSLTGDEDDSRAWRVMHVSWVCDIQSKSVWHAELGLD